MSVKPGASPEDRRTRNKALAALTGVIAVAAINQVWLWGVLFAVWGTGGMVTGRAYLVEEISQQKFPLLCWGTNVVWFAIGLSMIADPFLVAIPD